MPRIGDAMVIVFTLNARDRGLDPPSDTKDNKKSLKIPKRYSEPVYRRINNTMAKSTRENNNLQHTTVHRQLMIGQNKTTQKPEWTYLPQRVTASALTSGIYHATLVSDPVISHE